MAQSREQLISGKVPAQPKCTVQRPVSVSDAECVTSKAQPLPVSGAHRCTPPARKSGSKGHENMSTLHQHGSDVCMQVAISEATPLIRAWWLCATQEV